MTSSRPLLLRDSYGATGSSKQLACAVAPILDGVTRRSAPEAKIALFRALFRGREEVYPRRFENRNTGKSGYQPACGNEWIRGVCEKPRIKCADCRHQRFLPVADDTVRWHLSGSDSKGKAFVMGLYPMLLDETCFLLAVDFDKGAWRDDAKAYHDTCRRLDLPAALERSRSGNGAHIWIFFEQAIPAALARKLGSHVLTETMERRPDIGLHSYDRFFPNQDTLPRGGFGNLIALPLQGRARKAGNSVFLDQDFIPHPDQWEFLSAIRKVDRSTVEDIVHRAETMGRVIGVRQAWPDEDETAPWSAPPSRRRVDRSSAGPLPEHMELVLGDQVYIAKAGLPPGLRNRLVRLAAFQNPEFYKAQAMRLPTYGKPRIIACAEDHTHHLALPRGCLDDIQGLLSDLHIASAVRDERIFGRPLTASFSGSLREEQMAAATAMLAHDIGVLSATTAFGKTVVGAWLIAQRRVSTLVLVHRRQLLEQWIERLSAFLGLPADSIGRIGGGRKKPNGTLDVALVQSMVRKGVVDDRVGDYGQVVVDECHHVPAFSFEQVVRRAKAKYVVGLSATVARKDGHHPIIFMQCGPVRHHVDPIRQAASRPFEHRVIVRPTAFCAARQARADARLEFREIYDGLIADERRNELIFKDVIETVREGRSPVVLTERIEHVDSLAALLAPAVRHLVVLRGGAGKRERQAISSRLASIPVDEERVLLATGRYIGEGFDDARLDTLFLALPVSWRGTVAQYVGRLHRLNDRKREVRVYDYADLDVPTLARMFDRRCRGYEAVGYTINVPASAVPGWPADVALPVDPAWKSDYAASVRRLVRDGVDASLAGLFAATARAVDPGAEGADRARSAAEAFLYRRLEMLPATAGRFRLNADLPIPFAGSGRLEVDLLCADARIAIELDGGQHLESAEAYRRDRHKDALLQENGYFVLRFLAEDAAKRLDVVLDTIQRALVRRAALNP
jgi:superfamily II DNA or RNA helicase/very-short-patch-repair endonuclease